MGREGNVGDLTLLAKLSEMEKSELAYHDRAFVAIEHMTLQKLESATAALKRQLAEAEARERELREAVRELRQACSERSMLTTKQKHELLTSTTHLAAEKEPSDGEG